MSEKSEEIEKAPTDVQKTQPAGQTAPKKEKGKKSGPDFDQIREDLHGKDFRKKNEAIKKLSKLKTPQARDELYKILESQEWITRHRIAAINSLANNSRDRQFKTVLQRLAGDKLQDKEIRRAALTHLSRFRDKNLIRTFTSVLDDDYRFIRFWAVRGLLKLRDPDAIGPLVRALGDEDEEIRKDIQSHLELVGDQAVPYLIKAFKNPDSNKHLRYAAMGLLGRIDNPETLPIMIKALNDGNDRVVTIAIRGLGKSKSPKAVVPLIEAYKEKVDHQRMIENALFKIGQDQIRVLIVGLMLHVADSNEAVQKLIHSLLEKYLPESVLVLGDMLDDPQLSDEIKDVIPKLIDKLESA